MDKLAALNGILAQNPNDTFARYGLAMELRNQDRVDEALAEFGRILEHNPDYVPAYQMSAQTLIAQGESGQALARLEGGIAAATRTGNSHARAEMEALRDEVIGA